MSVCMYASESVYTSVPECKKKNVQIVKGMCFELLILLICIEIYAHIHITLHRVIVSIHFSVLCTLCFREWRLKVSIF